MSSSSYEHDHHHPWQYDWKRPQWHATLGIEDVEAKTQRITNKKKKKTKEKHRPNYYHNRSSAAVVLDHAAALVLLKEINKVKDINVVDTSPEVSKPTRRSDSYESESDESSQDLVVDHQEDTSFLLTVTLLADGRHDADSADDNHQNHQKPTSANVVELQVVKQEQHIIRPAAANASFRGRHDAHDDDDDDDDKETTTKTSTIFKRTLRWPESALECDEGPPPLFPWLTSAPPRQQQQQQQQQQGATPRRPRKTTHHTLGLVAACLCRLPPEDMAAPLANALDVVQLLSWGGTAAAGLTASQRAWLHRHQHSEEESAAAAAGFAPTSGSTASEVTLSSTDLILCCLSTRGILYFYSPWALLQKHDASTGDMGDGIASLLWGDVLKTVQDNFLPLSEPLAMVPLSVPLRSTTSLVESSSTKSPPDGTASRDGEDEEAKELNAPESRFVLDDSMWDPTVDGASLRFRTKDNMPRFLCYVGDLLCVAGPGRRVRRRRWRRRRGQSKAQASSPGGGGASSLDDADASTVGQFSLDTAPSLNTTTMPDDNQPEKYRIGGFVTFVSLRNYSEIRTVFLPFAPLRISPFNWGGMSFILVVGQRRSVAIRIDAAVDDVQVVLEDEAPGQVERHDNTTSESPRDLDDMVLAAVAGSKKKTQVPIRRFQILPIDMPVIEDLPCRVVGGAPWASPPTMNILLLDNHAAQMGILERSFSCISQVASTEADPLFAKYPSSNDGKLAIIKSKFIAGREAKIPLSYEISLRDFWCHAGQGWCLVGLPRKVYFICWEGATSARGAHVQQVAKIESGIGRGIANQVVPLDPMVYDETPLPFSEPMQTPSGARQLFGLETDEEENEETDSLEPVIVDALESISSLAQRQIASSEITYSPTSSSRRHNSFSHREKANRLLEHCSSWTELEQSIENRFRFEMQRAVVCARSEAPFLLSIRRALCFNGVGSPFQQVLAWLSARGDFFTAASLALGLLRDSESLRHLWMAYDRIDVDEEATKLEGLLDGIDFVDGGMDGRFPLKSTANSTLTQLADMTVGCLTKGGFRMASTLEQFLARNQNYSASRAALMLVAAAACTLSDDSTTVAEAMGDDYVRDREHKDNIMWPVRCLLKIGVAREEIDTVLLMINVTLPDELRCRKRGGVNTTSPPSMSMCKKLISLILESSQESADLLLGLVDEQSRVPYWESLEHGTQIELALIRIDEVSPMLRQPEVRDWALRQLQIGLESEESPSSVHVYENMPTTWLQQLTLACLGNGGCRISGLKSGVWSSEPVRKRHAFGLEEYTATLVQAREALAAAPGSGGVDFDLVIAALLILELRGEPWLVESTVPTQFLLNAACYLAGRRTKEEPLFVLDSATLMRQCYLAGNVQAGANLVGGRNGLVLDCCDILMSETGLNVVEAEDFLLADGMPSKKTHGLSNNAEGSFEVRRGHLQLLWLLQEHVLGIKKYGDFESSARGKVDPIFTARICLRTWWRLSDASGDATAWLVEWLRGRLEMTGGTGVSPHRLPCAALVRALIFPITDSDSTGDADSQSTKESSFLAAYLHMPNRFLVQLAQSCCGLVEAVQLSAEDETALVAVHHTEGQLLDVPHLDDSSLLSDPSV